MKKIGDLLGNSYSRELATEEWRSFSASVRSGKGNACHCCRRSDRVTQVHHMFYEWGKKAWEYDHNDVLLLCDHCHKALHEELKKFRRHVFGFLDPQSFNALNKALESALTRYKPLMFAHALCEIVCNERLIENHAKAWFETKTYDTAAKRELKSQIEQ